MHVVSWLFKSVAGTLALVVVYLVESGVREVATVPRKARKMEVHLGIGSLQQQREPFLTWTGKLPPRFLCNYALRIAEFMHEKLIVPRHVGYHVDYPGQSWPGV